MNNSTGGYIAMCFYIQIQFGELRKFSKKAAQESDQTSMEYSWENGINNTIKELFADRSFLDRDALNPLTIDDIPVFQIKQLVQRRLLWRNCYVRQLWVLRPQELAMRI